MKFDYLLIDFAQWLKSLLWQRKDESKARPYEVISSNRGKYGILSKVIRTTPRAVSTYVFVLYRYKQDKAAIRDFHICLDHLGAIEGQSTQPYNRKYTHRISVYSASHFLDKNGSYDLEVLFSQDYDLQLQSPYRDRLALVVMSKLASYIKEFDPRSIDWRFEIESVVKELVSGRWNTPAPPAKDEPIVLEGTILDGAKKGKRVQITVKED